MKYMLIAAVAYAVFVNPVAAATEFKDFSGQKCSKSNKVKIVKVADIAFASGPMKGYINVTVTLPTGETSTAPMPPELVKKIKVGDSACKATFVDQD